MQVDDDNMSLKEDFAHQVEIIFEARAKDMRIWNLLIILSNSFHQLGNLSNLYSTNMIVMQSVYWICILVGVIMTMISMKPGRLMLVKYAYILLLMRNILRLYNFEKNELTMIVNVS